MTSSAQRQDIVVFWFRRDLRLEDNAALSAALRSGFPVLTLFIFDPAILSRLEDKADKRVEFIHRTLVSIDQQLKALGSLLRVEHGLPADVWKNIFSEFNVRGVYFNRDYEPYASQRDTAIERLASEYKAAVHSFKDQVVFEKNDVVKDDGKPYTVFTPFSRKWKAKLKDEHLAKQECGKFASAYLRSSILGAASVSKKNVHRLPTLSEIGFTSSDFVFPETAVSNKLIERYAVDRNTPSIAGTSKLGLHLRFGTVSVRELVRRALPTSEVWLSELIWREFFMQILWNFPHVAKEPFKPAYAKIKFRNDEKEFKAWCEGRTGYPIVDAGMRELNETGFMHNRVRMVAASFLVKHLLIDWRWGEAYFAEKLLDFDLASNNGNWQWVAGTGCDAAPYFRVFRPDAQEKKFDSEQKYARRWIPELNSKSYPKPMVDHSFARERALKAYGVGLGKAAPPDEEGAV